MVRFPQIVQLQLTLVRFGLKINVNLFVQEFE